MGQARISVLLTKDYCRSVSLARREVQRDIDRAGPLFVPHGPFLRCLSLGCLVNSIFMGRGAPWEHESFVATQQRTYAYRDAMLV
jgi:hypothetical protein